MGLPATWCQTPFRPGEFVSRQGALVNAGASEIQRASAHLGRSASKAHDRYHDSYADERERPAAASRYPHERDKRDPAAVDGCAKTPVPVHRDQIPGSQRVHRRVCVTVETTARWHVAAPTLEPSLQEVARSHDQHGSHRSNDRSTNAARDRTKQRREEQRVSRPVSAEAHLCLVGMVSPILEALTVGRRFGTLAQANALDHDVVRQGPPPTRTKYPTSCCERTSLSRWQTKGRHSPPVGASKAGSPAAYGGTA
jgi:hypothetical protein